MSVKPQQINDFDYGFFVEKSRFHFKEKAKNPSLFHLPIDSTNILVLAKSDKTCIKTPKANTKVKALHSYFI